MKSAYIIGQISGLPIEEAKQNFDIKKQYLLKQGYYEVFTPFDSFSFGLKTHHLPTPQPGSRREWQLGMAFSIQVITMALIGNVDVYALPNYKNSNGAMIEAGLCEKLGISVFLPSFTEPTTTKTSEYSPY